MNITKFSPYNSRMCVLSVTGYENKLISGTVTNASLGGACRFDNQIQLIMLLDELFDTVNCPQKAMESRYFGEHSPQSIEPHDSTQTENGEVLATFKLSVLFRQNASWQGSIRWVENDLEAQFRSVLELLMIIDSAFTD